MDENSGHFPTGVLANRHVLVVEDDGDARELIMTVLKVSGATVTVADSFDSALEALKQFVPDALVLDIGSDSSRERGHPRAVPRSSSAVRGRRLLSLAS